MQGSVNVRFSVRDGSGNELAFTVATLQGPLAPGQTGDVFGEINIPDLGPGVPARILATVNPGCVVPEMNCDGTNVFGLDILIGAYNYLDLTPIGRNEKELQYGMAWVKHHDKY